MKNIGKFTPYLFIFYLSFTTVSAVLAQEKQSPKVALCSQCNTWNVKNAKFCAKCGHQLLKQTFKPASKQPVLLKKSPLNLSPEKNKIFNTQTPAGPIKTENFKAKILYDRGIALFEKGIYQDAKLQFLKIIKHYPSSKYAESASLMIKACNQINDLTWKWKMSMQQQERGKKSGTSSFLFGFLSSCGAMFLLATLLASG